MYNSINIVSNSNHFISIIVKSSKELYSRNIVFIVCSSFDQLSNTYDQCFVYSRKDLRR